MLALNWTLAFAGLLFPPFIKTLLFGLKGFFAKGHGQSEWPVELAQLATKVMSDSDEGNPTGPK